MSRRVEASLLAREAAIGELALAVGCRGAYGDEVLRLEVEAGLEPRARARPSVEQQHETGTRGLDPLGHGCTAEFVVVVLVLVVFFLAAYVHL